MLLTTVKWASATGKPFLGEDRSHSGVEPSVKVARPELADAIDPEDLTGNDDDPGVKPSQSPEKPPVAPEPAAPKAPVEDIQMKKALELLRESKQPEKRAA